jgi:nitrate/TMAO reductase-like tetraheme cytochrome c subunit
MRKYAVLSTLPILVAGMLAVGAGNAAAEVTTADAFCVYTTNQSTPVYSAATTSSSKLYTLATGSTVSAVDTAISGTGGPFYKGGAQGRAQGYIQVSHLYNKRSCAG